MPDYADSAASAPAESVTADLTALKEELGQLAPITLCASGVDLWFGEQARRIEELMATVPDFQEMWTAAIAEAGRQIEAAKAERQA